MIDVNKMESAPSEFKAEIEEEITTRIKARVSNRDFPDISDSNEEV